MNVRPYIKVTAPSGRQILCEVTSGSAHRLVQCENCKFRTQTALKLICRHFLCDECYENLCTAYTCQQDNRRTMREQAVRWKQQHHSSLEKVVLECPKCGSSEEYTSIMNHIRKKHPELLKKNGNDDDGRTKRQMRFDKCRNFNQLPSEEKRAPAVTSTDKVPELNSGDRHSCSNSSDAVKEPEKYMQSATTVQQREITNRTPSPNEHREDTLEDNRDWIEKTRDAVRELHIRVQRLEAKLDVIQEPLQMLMTRLSERH
ncbi:uncharacterized protein LOC144104321 isoform X1 [Amblyomma americanum]